LFVVRCSLFVVRCSLFVVRCLLFVVRCSLFVVCCLLFVVRCSLFVVRCLLFVVRCLLFVVRTFALSYLRAIDSKARPCFSTCMLSHPRTISLAHLFLAHLSPLLPFFAHRSSLLPSSLSSGIKGYVKTNLNNGSGRIAFCYKSSDNRKSAI
jgi:hypothetical protein